jgi:hypothetical protein
LTAQLIVIVYLSFGGRYIAERFQQAEVVERGNPLERGWFDRDSPTSAVLISPMVGQTQTYLTSLAENSPQRDVKPPKSAMSVPLHDPSRHIYIMVDDTAFSIRATRAPNMRDPLVSAFFDAGRHEVRA